MYLRNTLDNSQQTKKANKITNQIKLYKATSDPLIDQSDELLELSDQTSNITDQEQILKSLGTLKIGVHNHDNQIAIKAAKVVNKIAGLRTAETIKTETDKLMQSYETEGYKEVIDNLENQKNIISESLNQETLEGLNKNLAEVMERKEGLTRMLPYDTNLSTPNIDFPGEEYGYKGTQAYIPRTPGGEIDQAKKNKMESIRLSPEEESYLTDVIQPEYDVARKINTQEGWEDFNTLMKTMPTTLRDERKSGLKEAATAKVKRDKQIVTNKLDRAISGYSAAIDEVKRGINPIGLPSFDSSLAEGLPPQIKTIIKSIPNVSVYGNRNAQNALQSYDPKGLLGQVDEAILQMLNADIETSTGKVKEIANNAKFLTSDPTEKNEDLTGHRNVMDEIITQSMDIKSGEYKLHDQFDELTLASAIGYNTGTDRKPLYVKSQSVVEKMIQLRAQLLSDIENGIFIPYEDSKMGEVEDVNRTSIFNKRKNR
tara:strand:+ start:3066 stop:4520 length:1455 start_codon:yes stop_codon:yes gene_type:complete